MTDALIYSNGIDAETGKPLLPPLPVELVAELAQGNPINVEDLQELKARKRMLSGEPHFGVMAGVDPNDLTQAGWGVIFAFEDEARIPAIREALRPLLELRWAQAEGRYRDEVLDPKFFYRPGESKNSWLARNGGAPGPVDPKKVPYYLLIVGDPERIPYRFQYQLDVAHAVGRIHFETAEEFDSYARGVVVAEHPATPPAPARRAAFFGVQNGNDRATCLSVENLVTPLANAMSAKLADWQVTSWIKSTASKNQLTRLLGGEDTPTFLFSAGHGLGFASSGHARQRSEQGALVCSDWSGDGPVAVDMRLAAVDIGGDAHLMGLIAFLFACYGAGTPQFDEFTLRTRREDLQDNGRKFTGLEQTDPIKIAPYSFIARLPQRLLGHPRGGALAVVGHVDRAWGSSFLWEGVQQLTTFESTLTRLFKGDRLGFAMEDFNNRYAQLAADVAERIEAIKFRVIVPPEELARLWTANNDARNYIVLGDPAVRLPLARVGAAPAKPPASVVAMALRAPAARANELGASIEPPL